MGMSDITAIIPGSGEVLSNGFVCPLCISGLILLLYGIGKSSMFAIVIGIILLIATVVMAKKTTVAKAAKDPEKYAKGIQSGAEAYATGGASLEMEAVTGMGGGGGEAGGLGNLKSMFEKITRKKKPQEAVEEQTQENAENQAQANQEEQVAEGIDHQMESKAAVANSWANMANAYATAEDTGGLKHAENEFEKAQGAQLKLAEREETEREKTGKFARRAAGKWERKHAAGGGMDIGRVLLVVAILSIIFVMVVMPKIEPTSPIVMMTQSFAISAGNVFGTVFRTFGEVAKSFVMSIINLFLPKEVAGVPILNAFKMRTCEPFCTSESGEDTKWHGFEITQLKMFPSTVYDYQPVTIVVEFTNNGNAEAEFSAMDSPPDFGCVQTDCRFSLVEGLKGDEFKKCKETCPFSRWESDTEFYSSGTCAGDGGEIISPCTLAPGEVTTLRWYGIKIDASAVNKGQIVQPIVSLDYSYSYKPTTDLVGTFIVQESTEALIASEMKKEGRIINRISQSYSPTGPLMMAMGTAEEQIIENAPTLFLLQFANKGDGVVKSIDTSDMRVYVPNGFILRSEDEEYCDFINTTIQVPSMDSEWTPGPGYDGHWLFMPKEKITGLANSVNPNDNPMLGCMFRAPDVDSLKSYDFKVRVKEYEYNEVKQTKLKIIGTDRGEEIGTGSEKVTIARTGFVTGRDTGTITATLEEAYHVSGMKLTVRAGGSSEMALRVKGMKDSDEVCTYGFGFVPSQTTASGTMRCYGNQVNTIIGEAYDDTGWFNAPWIDRLDYSFDLAATEVIWDNGAAYDFANKNVYPTGSHGEIKFEYVDADKITLTSTDGTNKLAIISAGSTDSTACRGRDYRSTIDLKKKGAHVCVNIGSDYYRIMSYSTRAPVADVDGDLGGGTISWVEI